MRATDQQRKGLELVGQFDQDRGSFWARTGLSAETVYWAIFGLGLVVLALLVVEILSGLAA